MHTCEHEHTTALEIIEQACREHSHCPACGKETRPVAHGDVIWLECLSLADEKSRLARIFSFQAGHTKRVLVHQSPMVRDCVAA